MCVSIYMYVCVCVCVCPMDPVPTVLRFRLLGSRAEEDLAQAWSSPATLVACEREQDGTLQQSLRCWSGFCCDCRLHTPKSPNLQKSKGDMFLLYKYPEFCDLPHGPQRIRTGWDPMSSWVELVIVLVWVNVVVVMLVKFLSKPKIKTKKSWQLPTAKKLPNDRSPSWIDN